jgi:ribosome-associated toxin RatA of RatAB toxin-antitoxin module
MVSGSILGGGRAGARRSILALAIVGILAPLNATLVGTSEWTSPEVSVRDQEGIYSVSALFDVPGPPSAALSVLTDYERIPRFMPGVTTSVVRERSAERVVVEQEAVSRMMMFSKRVYLLLEVNEEANTLRFRDSAGRSFAVYEGAWRLSERDGRTAISYELRAKPKFDLPGFLLKRLLTRDAKTMIDRLRAEIAARRAESLRTAGTTQTH